MNGDATLTPAERAERVQAVLEAARDEPDVPLTRAQRRAIDRRMRTQVRKHALRARAGRD